MENNDSLSETIADIVKNVTPVDGVQEIVIDDDKDLIDITDRQNIPTRPVRWADASNDPAYLNHAEAIASVLELAAQIGPSDMLARVAAGLDTSRDHWLGLR